MSPRGKLPEDVRQRRAAKGIQTRWRNDPEETAASLVRKRDQLRKDIEAADYQAGLESAMAELQLFRLPHARWPVLWRQPIAEYRTDGYPPEWVAVAWLAKVAAGLTCQRCGYLDEGDGLLLHVHHRDGDPQNLWSDNLVVLCASCHKKVWWRQVRRA